MAEQPGPEQTVSAAFDRGAGRYDLLVSLNPGYHRHLRAAARMLAARLPAARAFVVDLGCGSGASTRALLGELPDAVDVVGIDASEGMLARAATKDWPPEVSFRHARAEDVATALADRPGPVDGMLAAYLFRNVPADRLDATLAGVVEALAPGGSLVVQDYALGP